MLKRLLKMIFPLNRAVSTMPIVPDGCRIYAIGDVHGRLDLLEDLQEQIVADVLANGSNKNIVQIFLGDYVDRGAASKAVIDWLLHSTPPSWERIFLKGNHEVVLMDFLEDAKVYKDWAQHGGVETLQSYGVKLLQKSRKTAPEVIQAKFKTALPKEHLEFFEQLLPFMEIGSYYFVHAGVDPRRSLEEQREQDQFWIRNKFLTSKKDFGKIIIHGHSITAEPEIFPNRINIDTGAYKSDKLTCVVLDGRDQRFLQTNSKVRRS